MNDAYQKAVLIRILTASGEGSRKTRAGTAHRQLQTLQAARSSHDYFLKFQFISFSLL